MNLTNPTWASLGEFLAMGGYGLYVWGSFGVTVLVVAMELWTLRLRRKGLSLEIDE